MPGSIEKRGKNSWRIMIPDGYDPDGKKRRITETVKFPDGMTEFQQQKECEKIKASLYHRVKEGQVVCSRQYTLEEFAKLWMEEYTPTAGLSPVTVDGYQRLLNGRIIPSLGRTKLHHYPLSKSHAFTGNCSPRKGRAIAGRAGSYQRAPYCITTACYAPCSIQQ